MVGSTQKVELGLKHTYNPCLFLSTIPTLRCVLTDPLLAMPSHALRLAPEKNVVAFFVTWRIIRKGCFIMFLVKEK